MNKVGVHQFIFFLLLRTWILHHFNVSFFSRCYFFNKISVGSNSKKSYKENLSMGQPPKFCNQSPKPDTNFFFYNSKHHIWPWSKSSKTTLSRPNLWTYKLFTRRFKTAKRKLFWSSTLHRSLSKQRENFTIIKKEVWRSP